MAKISRKVLLEAKRSLAYRRAYHGASEVSTHSKSMVFPYREGSLVQFRKEYSSYDSPVCPAGAMCLVMSAPKPSRYDKQKYVVDVMVSGELISDIPANILLLPEDEDV